MEQRNYDTVTEALADLKLLGYSIDFSILAEKECLICNLTDIMLMPDQFEIDSFYRFEGDSDPADAMIVYAISSLNNKIKGTVVNGYGIYADKSSSAIVRKLKTHPTSLKLDIVDNIIHYFSSQDKSKAEPSPKGTCPVCWGRQEYDGKIRDLLKDKQIDINNHQDSYTLIQDFVNQNISEMKVQEKAVKDCPKCSTDVNFEDK